MPPKFGTSGLRGLVTELTPTLVQRYVRAFIAACPQGDAIHVGRDLRPSSPDIAASVINAIRAAGLTAIDHGAIPTPALALASTQAGDGAVMITGSHIPADRNGLKFYVPTGEISKDDENAILSALEAQYADASLQGGRTQTAKAAPNYAARYINAFGDKVLTGMRVGVYEHSSVARDVIREVFDALGAQTVSLSRSDAFIPVDTEAVDAGTRDLLTDWAGAHNLDAIVSADGDGDRPMLADANGTIVPGDILGALTARFLGTEVLVTPVSSNTLVDQMPEFSTVTRTRIGSPFVIASMEALLKGNPHAKVVGYEANGGFLLGFTAHGPAGTLAPLMTRDSLLPLVAPLVASRAQGLDLAGLVATLPPRFTAADRVQEVSSERSGTFIETLSNSAERRSAFFTGVGAEQALDLTDGLRVTFDCGSVVHLRSSGNAPECRCYAEGDSPEATERLVNTHLNLLKTVLI